MYQMCRTQDLTPFLSAGLSLLILFISSMDVHEKSYHEPQLPLFVLAPDLAVEMLTAKHISPSRHALVVPTGQA